MILVFHVNATSNRQSPFATTQVLVVAVWCGWWGHHLQHYMVGCLNSYVRDAEYNGLCTLQGQIVFGRKTCQKIVRNMGESSLQHYSQITFQVEFCPRHPDHDILFLKRLMHEFWTISFKRIMFLRVLIGLFSPGSMTSQENLSHVKVLHFIVKWSSFPRDWFLDSIFNCRFFPPFSSPKSIVISPHVMCQLHLIALCSLPELPPRCRVAESTHQNLRFRGSNSYFSQWWATVDGEEIKSKEQKLAHFSEKNGSYCRTALNQKHQKTPRVCGSFWAFTKLWIDVQQVATASFWQFAVFDGFIADFEKLHRLPPR